MKRGGIITEAVTRALNPAVPLRESGIPWLGKVPAHWEVKRLKFQAGDGTDTGIQIGPFGGMLTELTYAETGEFKVYGQENVLSGDFEKGTRWISAEQYAELSHYAAEEGDFLFTRKGSIGGCAVFPEKAPLGIIDSDTIRLRVNPRTLSTRFLLHAFRDSEYLQFQVQLVKRGAILSGLNTMTIANLVLVAPPLDEQIAIAAFLDWKIGQIDALIARKKELLKRLKEKRLAVITQAVTRGINPAASLRDSGIPWLGRVDARRVAAHFGYKRRNVAQHRDEVGDDFRRVDHSCFPPSAFSRTSLCLPSCNTRVAASLTARSFLGEKSTHGSILLVIHAFTLFSAPTALPRLLVVVFAVPRPVTDAFALFSLTVRTRKLRSMSPERLRLRRLPLPCFVFQIAYCFVSGFAGPSFGPCDAASLFFTAATPTFPILNICDWRKLSRSNRICFFW